MSDDGLITLCRSSITEQLQLQSRYPTIDITAELLNISVRTLQRRLNEEKLSYSELVEEMRAANALRLIGEPEHTISEIGKMLCYTDPSSFTRAFRRWTGMSPSVYRRNIHI